MQLKVYTLEDLFELGKVIIKSETGVSFPFQRRTLHRALVKVAALFGADASIQTVRLTHDMTLEGLSGTLLERKGLEYSTPVRPTTPARLLGKIVSLAPVTADRTLAKDSLVIRPATTTQSAIEFQLEAAAIIPGPAPGPAGTESNIVSAVCTVYGTKGNGVVAGTDLKLKYRLPEVDHFEVTEESGGGFEKQTDVEYRSSIREATRGRHESTWAGLERLLKTVKLDSGQRIVIAKVFEDFVADKVYAYVDDGSGVSATVMPTDSATYNISGHTGNPATDTLFWEYTEHNVSIYVQLPYYHTPPWNDTVTTIVKKYTVATATWADLVLNTDYYVDIDSGRLSMLVALLPGDKLRVWFPFYTGLVGLAAKYVNGIVGDAVAIGWRPVGQQVQIRAPVTVFNPSVAATLIFNSGWDSQFGRELAQTYAITYLNSLNIGFSAKYGVINHILNGIPGVSSVENLLLNGLTTDCSPTNAYGVVRGNGVITL